jgi:hypothetical protein
VAASRPGTVALRRTVRRSAAVFRRASGRRR